MKFQKDEFGYISFERSTEEFKQVDFYNHGKINFKRIEEPNFYFKLHPEKMHLKMCFTNCENPLFINDNKYVINNLIYYDKQFGFSDKEEDILYLNFLVLSKIKTLLFLFGISEKDLIEILSINKYSEAILFSQYKIQNLYETENNIHFQKYVEKIFMEKYWIARF